ncbi:MAG: hypothetical protein ABSB42_07085 [Tepidisphaeraceae bacterium]
MLLIRLSAGFAQTEAPTTQSLSAVEEARLNRGEQMRKVLLDALEQSYNNGGVWPERFPLLAGVPRLIYTPPTKAVTAQVRDKLNLSLWSVVLREPIERYPD